MTDDHRGQGEGSTLRLVMPQWQGGTESNVDGGFVIEGYNYHPELQEQVPDNVIQRNRIWNHSP